MQQPIECGRCHDRVSCEDIRLLAERLVAGENGGLTLFVSPANHPKEQARLSRVEGQVAHFIENEKLGLRECVELAVQSVLRDCKAELV